MFCVCYFTVVCGDVEGIWLHSAEDIFEPEERERDSIGLKINVERVFMICRGDEKYIHA